MLPKLARRAGVQRAGSGKRKTVKHDQRVREENACKDAIVSSVFYVHQRNVKILFGQN